MRRLFAVVILLAVACGGDDDANRDPLVVSTSAGDVRGVSEQGLRIFRGVPYAAPPLGELRFRPPHPHPGWIGERQADAFGPGCLQDPFSVQGPQHVDEDCLTLSVWAQDDGDTHPVLVFVHGGGFVSGNAANPRNDAGIFARDTGAVVVAMNYRVGALGYLASPHLRDDDGAVGNYGLRDQAFALRWVRDNIAAFGGDPGRVTVMGESAGAFSVCLLMAIEESHGLFHAAILHSGCCSGHATPDESGLFGAAAFETAAEVVEIVGCSDAPDIGACLRGVDGQRFVDAASMLETNAFNLAAIGPVVDGVFVDDQPIDALAGGAGGGIPVMIGSTADDYSLFTIPFRNASAEEIEARFELIVDPVPSELLDLYDPARFGSAIDGLSAFMTDYAFACPTLRLASALSARGVPAYVFQFTATVGGPLGGLGSFHGLDWGLAFGNDDPLVELSTESRELGAAMRHTWGSFIRNGVPLDASGTSWPVYDPGAPAISIVDLQSDTVSAIRDGRCVDLERLGVAP